MSEDKQKLMPDGISITGANTVYYSDKIEELKQSANEITTALVNDQVSNRHEICVITEILDAQERINVSLAATANDTQVTLKRLETRIRELEYWRMRNLPTILKETWLLWVWKIPRSI